MSIQQRREIEWHIQAGDYFGTLATVLDLLRQLMDKQGYGRTEARLLAEVRDELVYLQENHRIVKRSSDLAAEAPQGLQVGGDRHGHSRRLRTA
jgi:hypothetical protein